MSVENLQVGFEEKNSLPLAMQDFFSGIIENHIIISCGCTGENIKKLIRGRHFSKKTFAVDVKKLKETGNITYQTLPDFIGEPRQKGVSIVYKNILMCWGGLNYTPTRVFTPDVLKAKKKNTKSFNDGYAMMRIDGKWLWKKLPDLPYYMCGGSLTVAGEYIYLFGGADYYDSSYNTWNNHENQADRFGARLFRISGEKIIKFLTSKEKISLQWDLLEGCPGTPRMNHIIINANEKLYVIGGASGRLHGNQFHSTVDNWVYDIKTNSWNEIKSSPTSNTNWQSCFLYKNRYIFLIGGAHTCNTKSVSVPRKVINNDQKIKNGYGKLKSIKSDSTKGIMSCDIIAYDTIQNIFIDVEGSDKNRLFPLPYDVNNPMNFYLGDDLFIVFGGEIEINKKFKRKMRTSMSTHLTDRVILGKIQKI